MTTLDWQYAPSRGPRSARSSTISEPRASARAVPRGRRRCTALHDHSAWFHPAGIRAFPVSVFRAAGFSPRGHSPFNAVRVSAGPGQDFGKCSSQSHIANIGYRAITVMLLAAILGAPETGQAADPPDTTKAIPVVTDPASVPADSGFDGAPETDSPEISPFAALSPRRAVREGNRLLLSGDAHSALDAYEHAGEGAPDALEVPFVEGLAYFDLAQFDEARRAFDRAKYAKNKALADDALYGLAACDHAEAVKMIGGASDGSAAPPSALPTANPGAQPGVGESMPGMTDPSATIAKLESAMTGYRDVLENNPDHALARESNRKAAALWREIKELLEQQQQQQQQQDQNQENDEQEDQEQESDQDQDSSDEQQQGDEGEQDQQQPSDAEQDENEQRQEQQQQQAQPQPQQDTTRQQAENKLRAWMERMRDRLKDRKEQGERMPVRPVEKDW